jgi:hypothetical protein
MNRITSFINRTLFVLSFVLAIVAVGEKSMNLLGYTVLAGRYEPSQLLGFAGTALLFVFALQLREIQHALQSKALR